MTKDELVSKSFELVNKGMSSLPLCADPAKDLEELHFELTYECNQKCVMCNVWDRYRLNPELKKKELTFSEIKKTMETSEYLKNIKLVLFSGGEPFLRKDFEELCSYFINKYKDISPGILSNLFHTRMIMEKLEKIHDLCKPTNLWIGSSLDGLNGKHDEVRGVKGAFGAMTRTIEAIRARFPAIRICLNFTLTTRNYNELVGTFKYAKELGMDLSAQFAVPWENAETYSWDPEVLTRIEESVDVILQDIIEDYKEKGLLQETVESADAGLLSKLYYWKGLTRYQRDPHRFFKRCVAGARFAAFSPNGDLYFCPILKNKIVGNIRDFNFNFDALWLSNAGNKIREFINKGNCHCWLNCTIYPNAGEAIQYTRTDIT